MPSDHASRRIIEASVVLVVYEERALVLRRTPDDRGFPHRWCLPGGQLDEGEHAAAAAVRESLEETGLRVALRESLGPRLIEASHAAFRIHRFTGAAARGEVSLSPEHVDFRWLARDEARRADGLLPTGLAGEVTEELLARFALGEW